MSFAHYISCKYGNYELQQGRVHCLILKSRGVGGGIKKRIGLRPLRKICTTVKSMYIETIASYFEQVFVCWIPLENQNSTDFTKT